MKTVFIIAMTISLATSEGPPTKPTGDNAYVAVRVDVLERLNLSDLNLPKCRRGLEAAGSDLIRAQSNIEDLHNSARSLKANQDALEKHIAQLNNIIIGYESSAGDQFVRGWESVDGMVGLGVGWAVGTAQCVGLAYVFNQPGFGG